MNTNAILGLGVAAVILIIASLYALIAPPSSSADQRPMLDILPSSITMLSVHHDAHTIEHVERTDSGWLYSRQGSPSRWPVNTNNINGALRLLADLHAPRNSNASKEATGPHVELTLSDSSTRTIQFGEARIGGSVAMRVVDGPSSFVDDSIRAMFFQPGPSAWRAPQALPGVNADVSRIHLTRGNESITLSRVANSWQLTEPIAYRSDQQRVTELLRALIGLGCETFLMSDDEIANARELVSSPDLVIETTTVQRVAENDGQIDTQRNTRTLLVRADGPAGRVLAHNLEHDTLMTLDSDSLDSLAAFDALTLIDPTACGSLHVDVAGIELDRPGAYWRFIRSIDGWSTDQGPADADGSALDMLIGFLTDAPAEDIRIAPMPTLDTWCDITLLDLSQQPLETITLGIDTQGVMHAAVPTLDGQIVVLTYNQSIPSLLEQFLTR
ncbi:MAG: DUF4340 domain-containing protein [Phycisphaerales bacterium JB043]